MAKESVRINGKSNESMWVTDDELCFRTGGKVLKMTRDTLRYLAIDNAEDARAVVSESDLVPYGAWTEGLSSSKGKSVFVVAKDDTSCWVMEISKNQQPTAQSFVKGACPPGEKKDEVTIPGRVIDTPLGGLFTVGTIVCVFLAVFLVFTFDQPLLGLIAAVAAIVMWANIK